ncbi:MAG: ABC transporter ATP-binding protein [Limisphaerales bacterium]
MPLTNLLAGLWGHVDRRRRIHLCTLLVLIIINSFAEVISIGALLPFLAVITSPSLVFEHPEAQFFIQWLEIKSSEQLLLPLTCVFIIAVTIAGLLRILVLWSGIRLSNLVGSDIGAEIYKRTLYQSYSVHLARNSSEIIDGITARARSVAGIFSSVFTIVTSCLILLSIMIVLFVINPNVAIATFVGFSVLYWLIITYSRNKLAKNSEQVAAESTRLTKTIQEGLGGIRDVLIDGSQELYCRDFRKADLRMRHAAGNTTFIGQYPRHCLEIFGVGLVALLALFMASRSEGTGSAVPILGAVAFGAQRMLPAMNQAFTSWSVIQGSRASLVITLDLLDQPLPLRGELDPAESMPFLKDIEVANVSFRYKCEGECILKKMNFSIPKGAKVGIRGRTGCGKSTLVDVIMGLLIPTEGGIRVDGRKVTTENLRSWQNHIAHVPQSIFLADASIEENIALGRSDREIDCRKVREVAKLAQISKDIDSWEAQYATVIGERGIRLSGGQRQRIGIARALYKDVDVLILDEATSALDEETESAIMNMIDELSDTKTIIIIAHRLSTLRKCTHIIDLESQAPILQENGDNAPRQKKSETSGTA